MSDVMQQAYKLAAVAVRKRFGEQRPQDLKVLDKIKQGDVSAFAGSYDEVQKIFDCLHVPCRVEKGDAKKLSSKIAFINCPGDQRHANDLAGHVQNGMSLVTGDWAINSVVQNGFPNTIRRGPGGTGDEVIGVEPMLDSIWNDVVVPGADPQWWLEGGSYPIAVENPDAITVEAVSHEMLVRFNTPIVAVRFDWGKGEVFHVISHFWHKRVRTPGERYSGPCRDFLKAGMKLSDKSIDQVIKDAKVKENEINFAAIQSAATSTELVAQLCVQAMNRN